MQTNLPYIMHLTVHFSITLLLPIRLFSISYILINYFTLYSKFWFSNFQFILRIWLHCQSKQRTKETFKWKIFQHLATKSVNFCVLINNPIFLLLIKMKAWPSFLMPSPYLCSLSNNFLYFQILNINITSPSFLFILFLFIGTISIVFCLLS